MILVSSINFALFYYYYLVLFASNPVSSVDSNIFLDPTLDEIDFSSSPSSPSSLDLGLFPISSSSSDSGIFTDDGDESLNNIFAKNDIDDEDVDFSFLAYCPSSDTNNQQQQQSLLPLLLRNKKSKSRKKRDNANTNTNTICPPPQNGDNSLSSPSPPPPPIPVPVPQFPDLLNSITGPAPMDGDNRWRKVQEEGAGADAGAGTGAVFFAADEAEYYCGLWTSKPRAYKKPVCGSGNELDSNLVARAFYSYVRNSWLGEFFFFLPP